MRLARLDLLRYGRFTNVSIELPRAERDIHIVFGPNEAGKTTSLTAIEDLLFGIPHRSPYNFLHGYEAMRLGAVLEDDGDRLEFQRRKTLREMILGPDENPLSGDERLLAPFLGGADRPYFERMFNLSHSRLAQGGRAIIEAKDDVGQMLFAAGTGLSDLRERLKRLKEDADELWAPRKSTRRLYYQARDRLEEAQSRQRERSVSVNAWKKARKLLSKAEQALKASRKEYEETSRELNKLVRIVHVHAAVRERNALTQERAGLGDVTILVKDAADQLDEAEKKEAEIRAQVDNILAPDLKNTKQKLEDIKFDDALIQRADEIMQLNEQRIEVRRGRQDLPKRRNEYHRELESLAKLATEISWDFEEASELIGRMPSRSKIKSVRRLVAIHGEVAARLDGAREALLESQAALQRKKESLEQLGGVTDVSELAAVLKVVPDLGDLAGRIHSAEKQVEEITDDIERKLRSMKPFLPANTDIEALALPPRNTVLAHRDEVRDWARNREKSKQQLIEASNYRQRDQEALERRVRNEGTVAPGALEEARSNRDTLWHLVKARYISCSEIPIKEAQAYAEDSEDLPASLEEAVKQADSIADQRFEKAQMAGELAVLADNVAAQETRIRQLEEEEEALKAEGEQLDKAWHAIWADVPIEVLAPDFMLAWLEAREAVVALIKRQRDVQRQLEESRRKEQDAIGQVRMALLKVGWDAGQLEANELRVMVERADTYRREQETKANRIIEMRDAMRSAKSKVARRQREVEKAEAKQNNWQADWAKAITAIDLKHDGEPNVLSARINVIDDMLGHAAAATDLRDKRIATIERDIETFDRTVAAVTAELAPDLKDRNADASVVELDRRRDAALTAHQEHQELTSKVTRLRGQIEKLEEDRKAAWISVQQLMQVANVEDAEDLRKAIVLSDQFRALDKKLAGVMKILEQQGDGLAIEVLEEECRDVDIDAVKVAKETAAAELEMLGKRREESAAAQYKAKTEFEAIWGDDEAAKAAADCEEALASMQDVAVRYVRVRTSATLLQWAIDRYRKEKQGPLLKRASELFRTLTRNSFEKLEVGFDEQEAIRLTGVRPDGGVVAMSGLSSGTEDQLYLALRIAAVEDYLERAVALPFVADDLFINFDPNRSAAGFEVLGQLAERTQVLFYTHHPHLVDLARETLGEGVHLVTLDDAA